jgi:hypothetical protein
VYGQNLKEVYSFGQLGQWISTELEKISQKISIFSQRESRLLCVKAYINHAKSYSFKESKLTAMIAESMPH